MAITIDATIGGASSNSFATEEELTAYAELRIGASAILAATDEEDRRRALVMATERLNWEQWQGSRVASTQRLAHPRYQMLKPDGYGSSEYGALREYYLSTEIAQPVIDATCALALAYLDGFREDDENAVESFTADGVSVRFRQTGNGGRELPLEVQRLIEPLTLQGRLVRA